MKQAKVLTDKEIKRVLSVVHGMQHGERNRLAIMLSHYAGLRVGEIAALKMGDVVGTNGEVHDRLHLNPAYTKGGVGRTVFINAKLSKEIQKYRAGLSGLSEGLCGYGAARRAKRMLEPSAPLIVSQKRGHFSANSLCQLFGEIYAAAGVVGATSHSGRRSFITKLAHSGISPKVIMELAGHKQLTTTQRYIDVTEEMKKEAVEVL